MTQRTVLYQSVGDRLTQWDVDVDAATLTPRASITLPSNIQYAWLHPSPPPDVIRSVEDLRQERAEALVQIRRLEALVALSKLRRVGEGTNP